MPIRVLAPFALVLIGLACGCGGGGAAPAVTVGAPDEQLLGPATIDRYMAGTPSHDFLRWWRDAQFANLDGFLDGFAARPRRELRAHPKTDDALTFFAGGVRSARPQIIGVMRDGEVATIYTMIVYRRPVGTSRYISSALPRAFPVIRQQDRWRLANDSFFQSSIVEELRRS